MQLRSTFRQPNYGVLAPLAGLLAMSALVAPAMASAAFTPYSIVHLSEPYQPLPLDGGGPVETLTYFSGTSGDTNHYDPKLPPGFTVRFFDEVYGETEMAVGTNGYVTFGPFSSSNSTSAQNYVRNGSPQLMDNVSVPNQLVALWWDDNACDVGDVTVQTLGVAPARVHVIQTHCRYWSSSNPHRYEAQLWLYEGSSTMKVHYGQLPTGWISSSNTATGMSSHIDPATGAVVGYDFLGCGNACNGPNWVADKVIMITQGPELLASEVQSESILYSGTRQRFSALASNVGGRIAEGVKMRFYLSADEKLSGDDALIGESTEIVDLDSLQHHTFVLDAPVPWIPAGEYFVLAHVDPEDAVAEGSESNNFGISERVRIGDPAPDLLVAEVAAPVLADIEEGFSLGFRASNVGNVKAASVPYWIVASANDIPSATDLVLYRGTFDVDLLSDKVVDVEFTPPDSLATGAYYIGVIIDPDDVVFEIDEYNNLGATAERVFVTQSGLAMITDSLPTFYVGQESCISLEAAGGNGVFEWEAIPELPNGLELVQLGDGSMGLCGVPAERFSGEVTLVVRSDGHQIVRDFELEVAIPDAPLVIEILHMPVATYGIPYDGGGLSVVGGVAPYEWRLISGELPLGMSLHRSGRLLGTPRIDGTFNFVVEVRDANERRQRATIRLDVASPAQLSCATHELQPRLVGEEASERLLAAGGLKPYHFEPRSVSRVSDGGETQALPSNTPPGLKLSEDGLVSGVALEAGRYIWTVEVRSADNRTPVNCIITADVRLNAGMSIRTTALPDAYVNTPYRGRLVADGFQGAVTWSLAKGGGVLPEGLEINAEEGTIVGSVESGVLQGEQSARFAFMVHARDSEGRVAEAPLSITLYSEPPKAPKAEVIEEETGGCASAAAAPSLLALAGGLALLARRRRR